MSRAQNGHIIFRQTQYNIIKMFVTSDEFNVLGKRVERMEAAVANVVRKV